MDGGVWFFALEKKKLVFKRYPAKKSSFKSLKKSKKKKKSSLASLFFTLFLILGISFISATAIDEELHLNIQVINSSGDVETGTFDFEFNISTLADCSDVVYTNFTNLTTDSRGIISYYLEDVNLDFSSQYWLCYYRDDVLINASKIARTPYSFTAKNVSAEGIINDSNVNLVGKNITASSGLFDWLGSLLSRVTKLFVQDIDFSGNMIGSGNITINGYYSGQPIDGVIGSVIINASEQKTDGTINVVDAGGLDVDYPDLEVRIWNVDGSTTYCNIAGGTETTVNNAHTVYYIDSTCTLQSDTWAVYFAKDINPANYKRIFDVYTKAGDIEELHGASIEGINTRATRWLNVNCGAGGHLAVCAGIDVEVNAFPYFNQTVGSFRYVNTQHSTILQNTETDGIHIVAESDGSHTPGTGIDLANCDNGVGLAACSNNFWRRYVIYSIGFDGSTKIHQLAPVDAETYTNLAACMDVETNPISYTLPSDEAGVAVVHNIYCGKRDDSVWRDGWIDIRVSGGGFGAAIPTDDFMRYSGWSENADANDFNLTGLDMVGIGTTTPTHTLNVDGTLNVTGASVMDDVDFNGGWTDGGVSITEGDLYAQTIWVYNLSTLSVNSLSINGSLMPPVGFDDTFDIGSASLRWRDLYLSGNVHSNGTDDNYFLGDVGIGTGSPGNKLNVIGTGNFTTGVTIPNDQTYKFGGGDFIKYWSVNQSVAVGKNAGANRLSSSYFGDYAGQANLGSAVTAIGHAAGTSNTGDALTAIGYAAGHSNSGISSTVTGYETGKSNTGDYVTATGYFAGQSNKGSYLTVTGSYAGYENKGNYSSGYGYEALRSNTGNDVVGIGSYAGYGNTGNYLTATGYFSGHSNSGDVVTAIGYFAGYLNTGNSLTATGYKAGQSNSGDSLTVTGVYAGESNTGDYLTATGYYAGYSNKGNYSSGFGYEALRSNTGNDVVGIGYQAGYSNTGNSLTATGYAAGQSNSGSDVTVAGYQAGYSNTRDYLTATGSYAGLSNTGASVTAIGYQAGYSNKGNYSTATGYQAGYSNLGNSLIATGYEAGKSNTGTNVVAIGHGAGKSNSGDFVTATGYGAANSNTGDSVTATGYNAGISNTGNSLTATGLNAGYLNTGNTVTVVGYIAGESNAGNYSTGIGYEALRNNLGNNVVGIGYQAGKDNAVRDQFIVKQANVNAVPLIQGNFSSGFVGIGTTSPDNKLDIEAPHSQLRLTDSDDNNFTHLSYSSNILAFRNNNISMTPILAIHDNGNVGIGTTAPTHELNVVGNVNITGNLTVGGLGAGVPANSIMSFYQATCPTGWILADGTSGTPDLRGIFVRGAGTSGSYKYANGSYFSVPYGEYQNDSFQGHRMYAPPGSTRGFIRHTGGVDGPWTVGSGVYIGEAYTTGDPVTDTVHGTPRTGAETAPASFGLIYCMKTTEDSGTSTTIWGESGNDIVPNNSSKNVHLYENLTIGGSLILANDTMSETFTTFVTAEAYSSTANNDYEYAYCPEGYTIILCTMSSRRTRDPNANADWHQSWVGISGNGCYARAYAINGITTTIATGLCVRSY